MFARMLRPSRRSHVHERISQNEHRDSSAATINDSGGDGNTASNEGTGPAIVVLGDGDDRDLNLLEEGAGPAAADAGGPSRPIPPAGDDANEASGNNSPDSTSEGNGEENPLRSAANGGGSSEDEDEEEGTLQPNPSTHPFLTSQIQTERELRYRRQSTCTLLILFFLIRLWIEAIMEKDVGLIFLSMMGTMWTYRWFVTRREAEEEFDRQIVERENGNTTRAEGVNAAGEGEGTGADAAVNFDPDLGLMSFQAQLALAILESQRQMFENGGYGGNDRTTAHDGPGVTSEAKEKWKTYEWGDIAEETAKLAGLTRVSSLEAIKRTGSGGSNYGSVSTIDMSEDEGDANNNNINQEEANLETDRLSPKKLDGGLLSFDEDEEPSCSICLCEYERGEKVIRLPCDHVYHTSCLESWTENHVRCPLCNYDLMDGFEQPAHVQQARQHAEEQRAFRSMALSTLGRRIRTRRSARGRGSTRASTAAALAEAAGDSIV